MDEVHLATIRGGRKFVMAFRRWGMAGAQPCFYSDGLRRDVGEFVTYERHYRDDILDIDHPDARLIAAAPEIYEAAKKILEMYGPSTDYSFEAKAAWEVLEAAIAKADGTAKLSPPVIDAVGQSDKQPHLSPRA